jgi:hypothetical protein
MNKLLINKIDKLEQSNKEILDRLNASQTKVVTGFNQQNPHLGPRLQKINPDTLKLIKVYESATEVMNEDRTIKRPSLSKAVLENTVYNGFRWLFVERDMDSTVIHNLQPTRQTVAKNMDYVAKLNKDQTEIINVYLDRKTAALMNGYSMSGLDNAVKKGIQTQGFYYKLYSNCNKEIIQKFTEKYVKNILLYKDGIGMYNESGKLVKEYKCKYECIKLEKISDKTLAKAMAEDKAYNGYKFRMLPSRLSC